MGEEMERGRGRGGGGGKRRREQGRGRKGGRKEGRERKGGILYVRHHTRSRYVHTAGVLTKLEAFIEHLPRAPRPYFIVRYDPSGEWSGRDQHSLTELVS